MTLDLLFVGGCHRDVVARPDGAFQPGTSCPGRVAEKAGGVARNVAVLVASAGLACAFAGRVGDDAAGRTLRDGLASAGIDVSGLGADPEAATGTYVAIHDGSGELAAAVSDLAIYDRIGPATVAALAPRLLDARRVFADANLPADTLAELAARLGPRLAVDAISRAKAARVLEPLRAGALGFLNRPAAEALVGQPLGDAREAAAALASLGARRAVVTAGPEAVAVLQDGRMTAVPVPPATVVDVTGAGDALSAGTLAALARGVGLVEAVGVGILAARSALRVVGALDSLPVAVQEAADRIRPAPR